MIATLTNTGTTILNRPNSETIGSGPAGLVSVGGGKLDPLPYPFSHNGQVAVGATLVLAVHPTDFLYTRTNNAGGLTPRDKLNQLIGAGKITIGYAAQTVRRDTAEVFFNAI